MLLVTIAVQKHNRQSIINIFACIQNQIPGMKKHYMAIAAFTVCTFLTQAQIVVTDADLASQGDTVRFSTTTDQWGIDASETGTNHTWDFSFLANPQSQKLDTCADVGSLPIAYQFYFNNAILYPNWKASFAIRGQDISIFSMFSMTNVYDFYRNSSSKYQNVGFGANINGIPASVRKNPIETVYSLPMSFGDSFTNYSEYVVSIPTLGEYREKKWKSVEVDGWGTLVLPIGSFPVLRVKSVVNIVDSVYVDMLGFTLENPRPAQIEYHWIGQMKDLPLLQINADSASGVITQIRYQDIHHSLTGINEQAAQQLTNVYPNPVSDQFNVVADELILTLNIYDVAGRQVSSFVPLSNRYTVQIPSALVNGTYVLECVTAKGTQKQKLVLQR